MTHFGQNLIKSYPGLLEKDIWIESDDNRILIKAMSNDHKKNVLKYLKVDLCKYPFRDYFKSEISYNEKLDIPEDVFNDMKKIYELLVSKIDELER